MIGSELVCVGRYPSRDEVLEWLRVAIREKA